MNLFERLDHEIWATTMILLPKAHICSAAQHWASDFCPSVPQHCLIFKLITMTAIIIVGHWRGLICWTSLTGKNNKLCVLRDYVHVHVCSGQAKEKNNCGWSSRIVSLGSNYVSFYHVYWTYSTSRLDIIAFVWRQMIMLTFQYSGIERGILGMVCFELSDICATLDCSEFKMYLYFSQGLHVY